MENRCKSHRDSDSTNAALKQHCVENNPKFRKIDATNHRDSDSTNLTLKQHYVENNPKLGHIGCAKP